MSFEQENHDPIYERFLQQQIREGMELSCSSDLFKLHLPPMSPPNVVAEFHCKGLIREGVGDIKEASCFQVGIWFPSDYLRRSDPFQMLRMYTQHVWHPNISREHPLICVGRVVPGTTLVDLLYQIFDILTYQKYNPREDDSLNREACSWARANQGRFPIDRRPLKRNQLRLEVR